MPDLPNVRYSRHIGLPSIGAEGQKKLANATVMIIGLGGLGSTASIFLATSGIGRMYINDFDRIDASNLPRQILFDPDDIGRHKAEAAANQLRRWNPDAHVIALPEYLEPRALAETVSDCDIVLDCTDNFPARWSINEISVAARKPLVSGAAIRLEGQVSVFVNADGKGPCYRCLYAEEDENLEDCAGQGVLAPVAGTIGCMLATETIKQLVGLPSDLAGSLWLYDAMSGKSRIIGIPRRDDCPVCVA